MNVYVQWKVPSLITGMPLPLVEKGYNSTEREVQAQRETQVLATLFFSKEAIPFSPAEPDAEREEHVDPIVVPLDDVSANLFYNSIYFSIIIFVCFSLNKY